MPISKKGRLGLVTFGLITGLVIAEIALRVIGYSYPEFYVTDYSRGYSLRPNTSGWYRKENQVFIQINSDGLRDREHQLAKPADTFRIAIVGDSYAEGLQVPLEATFWSILEKRLNSCSPKQKRVEVINFGVSGYGTAQELITLREQVWKYSPDAVLLTITTNNDITDNSPVLKRARDVPFFLNRDGKLTLDNSFRDTPEFQWRQSRTGRFGRWLRDHFRVVQAVIEGHRALRLKLATWRTSPRPQAPSTTSDGTEKPPLAHSEELGTDNFVYREPSDSTWADAWNVTEKLIETMRDEVMMHNARFVAVTLSNGIQVAPDQHTRTEFMKRFGAGDLFYPDLRIKNLGDRNGFEVINLAPDLLQYAEANKIFLHGFGSDLGSGHWNEKGHQVAGEMLSQKLCQKGWLN